MSSMSKLKLLDKSLSLFVGKAGDGTSGRNRRLEYRFIIANPSSYLYVDERRPVPGTNRFEVPREKPESYNAWRYGLEKRNAYANRLSLNEIATNVFERPAYYLIGTEDNKQDAALSKSAGSMLQGENRYDRWEKFRRYVELFPKWKDKVVFAEVPGAGHSGRQMYESPVTRKAIFE